MKTANDNGAYEPDTREELARYGFPSYKAAKEAGTAKLLVRPPRAWESGPRSVHELAAMRAQIERALIQPSSF